MKSLIKLKLFLKRVYRLSLNPAKQEKLIWNDLKKLHIEAEWKHGIFEKDKYIETVFEIHEGHRKIFYFMVYDSCFHCRVEILEDYPVELTTELFILATHFNNLLNFGVVIVNVDSSSVEYHQKKDLLIPLLNGHEMIEQITRHFRISKDIYSAFQRLVKEQEAPAIIIADIIRKNEKEGDGSE